MTDEHTQRITTTPCIKSLTGLQNLVPRPTIAGNAVVNPVAATAMGMVPAVSSTPTQPPTQSSSD